MTETPQIFAVKCPHGVEVWRKGDEVHSIFTPDCLAYTHWLVVAEEQAHPHD